MSLEQFYFDTLKRISGYADVEKIKRVAAKTYGLTRDEAVEMAYENVLEEARRAIKGRRRPKDKT